MLSTNKDYPCKLCLVGMVCNDKCEILKTYSENYIVDMLTQKQICPYCGKKDIFCIDVLNGKYFECTCKKGFRLELDGYNTIKLKEGIMASYGYK